ncbi:Glutathione-dependent formaldehyde-activating, GFA [Akanthomyces lecanii RCEF 1005]|uniref:Glutathione-dependent formaldehyde-activating, GFA n=1 Tax=Akanthomyces lecanii RCEF 1005 TaxID=1081108 RepID=A0A162KB31_CORDF|nr:Glutathione-dependent formaldehyde-activating, GFA [Akanthomyces lecanii RCEF 1005]
MFESTGEPVTYKANCHCGRVKFTVALPDIRNNKVLSCNCSICTKNGYLLVYPKVENVKFISGEDELKSYRFGTATKPHKFCPECGTSILIDFSETEHPMSRAVTAVNARTFVDIEDIMADLNLHRINGKDKMLPPYKVPEF